MRAVVMAGGEGTRLRPITSLRPKPMVPVVGQPIMEHILGLVKHHGMLDVVATLAFMPQVIQDYFGDGDEWGMRISYTVEDSPLGTAGSVKNAERLLDEPFVVISGDALTDIDLAAVMRFHESHDGPVTIALKRVPDPLEFGVVMTGEDGRIERFLEKPSWGQVFSDTINTGIYVLDPMVFDHIPSDEPFDFSGQLFPRLMELGYPLYGCVVDGYWCDVGNLASYRQVHRDILDDKAMVFVPGTRTRDGVWLGKGVDLDPGATVEGKVVIGANTKVRRGARLGAYTVTGENCLIGADADIQHSIVWNDAFIGTGAVLRGAVVCRRADIRARARLQAGSAIGDETTVGRGATVADDVQVYPFKRIEDGATVASSLIWQNTGTRTLFGTDGISGLVNIDVTPELALRVAQAFGSLLPSGSSVVVSRDASRSARMMKRAIVAGLNSAGIDVRDLRVGSSAVARFTTRKMRCLGGVYACAAADDPQSVELHLYDRGGIEIAPWMEKKAERLYFREEFRRSFFDDVGEITYPPRALEYYAAGLREALGGEDGLAGGRHTVVVDMGRGVASTVLPLVTDGWPIDAVTLHAITDPDRTFATPTERAADRERLVHSVRVFDATLGVAIDAHAERVTLVTPSGRLLDPDTALHALVELWCAFDDSGEAVAVPRTASHVVEALASRHGHPVVRCGIARRALAAAAAGDGVGMAGSRDGAFLFPRFLPAPDAVMTVGMAVRMLDALDTDLDAVVDGLPPFFLRHERVHCPVARKGAVMRHVSALSRTHEVELLEGVRIIGEAGWALVLPHPVASVVEVYAEGDDAAAADEIVARYAKLVRDVVAHGDDDDVSATMRSAEQPPTLR